MENVCNAMLALPMGPVESYPAWPTPFVTWCLSKDSIEVILCTVCEGYNCTASKMFEEEGFGLEEG